MKINAGEIYAFDAKNELHKKQVSVRLVKAVSLKRKKTLFKEALWVLIDVEEPDRTFIAAERFLFPADTPILRLPTDMPVFSQIDINAISKLITKLEQEEGYARIVRNDKEMKESIKRLKAIGVKIQRCLVMREV